MQFFHDIKDSIYNPGYYETLSKKGFGYSIKYLLKLSLLFAVAGLVYGLFVLGGVRDLASILSRDLDKLVEAYPENLQIIIKDGKATSNSTEPILIPLPELETFGDSDIADESINNLMYVDTGAKFDLSIFEEYRPLIYVSSDAFVAQNENGSPSLESWSEFPEVTVSRQLVNDAANYIRPIARILPYLVLLIFPLLGFLMVIWNFAYLLFGALVVWMAIAIMGKTSTYRNSYQIGIHAITLPLFVTTILFLLGYTLPTFSFSAALAVMVFFNMRKSEPITTVS